MSFFAPFLLLFALLHRRPKDLLTLIKILLMIIFMSIQNISGKGKWVYCCNYLVHRDSYVNFLRRFVLFFKSVVKSQALIISNSERALLRQRELWSLGSITSRCSVIWACVPPLEASSWLFSGRSEDRTGESGGNRAHMRPWATQIVERSGRVLALIMKVRSPENLSLTRLESTQGRNARLSEL